MIWNFHLFILSLHRNKTPQMLEKTKYFNLLLIAGILIYAWITLVFGQGELLYAAQDFNPFLGTETFFKDCISHPGGLREWVGGWLTQLFYYPWLGATVQVLMWTISVIVLVQAFHLKRSMQCLTLIPVLALLTSMTQLGYWIFCLKTPSYWMGPTVGFTCVSLALWLYAALNGVGRIIMLPMWIILGFMALGWYATIGLVAMLLMGPMVSQGFFHHWPKWLLSATGVSCFALAVVALYYQNSPDLHWREPLLLYGFHRVAIPEAQSTLMEVCFHVMAVTIMALPIIAHLRRFRIVANYGWIFSLPLLAAALYGGAMLNYRNANFHTELTLLRQMEHAEWDNMLRIIRKNPTKPTREMVIMKDVALAHKGTLGDEAFAYDVRAVRPKMATGLPIHMAHSAGMYFYYWLGMPNYAYMWCMENSIEYGMSPFLLRLMYRYAVVSGEHELAIKYKKLLQTMLFHDDLEVSEEEIAEIREFRINYNTLSNDDGYPEGFIINRLANAEYQTPKAQQLALHYAMLLKDGESFNSALKHYRELVGEDATLPKYVQEAAAIFDEENDQPHQGFGAPYAPTYRWYFDNYTDFKTY